MAETQTPTKRHREEDNDVVSQIEPPKRHKNPHFNEQQSEPDPDDNLLDFFTYLSSDPLLDFTQQPEPDPDDNLNPNPNPKQESDDEKESVIRHLLEASDDELGIPSRVDGGINGGDNGDGGDDVSGSGYGDFLFGLWEIEDEAANYFTLLQSELFMQ
ncbi:hypothetical protein SSX86_007196 [Deinandra increscens subsp. villosa]|uniref:Uncharacterized protein n=1 Tax=Deinandra increscens subsp. villosa TaxID=3103831 RepID=A0AAP0DKC8_9ASTR